MQQQLKIFSYTGLILAALFSSLAQAADLVVWHAYRGGEKAAFEKVVELYNMKMAGKGIKVTTLAIPYDAYADKISAAVPRGKGPDVFIYAQDRLGGWIESGKTVEPIDFFMDDATRNRFLPGMLDAMTYRGSVYGLPLNYKSITLIYNKALIKTPPRTSSELVKIAKQHTNIESGRYGLVYFYNNFYFQIAINQVFSIEVGYQCTIDRVSCFAYSSFPCNKLTIDFFTNVFVYFMHNSRAEDQWAQTQLFYRMI